MMHLPKDEKPVSQIIKNVTIPHCSKGPKLCKHCEDFTFRSERYYLLNLFNLDIPVARPMIRFNGTWYAYTFAKLFENEEDAEAYAKKYKIVIIK